MLTPALISGRLLHVMGDDADYALSCIEDELYFANVMYLEEHDSYIGPSGGAVKKPICRFCGKKNLRWEQIGERWFLFEKKAPHNCPKKPLSLEVLKKIADDRILSQRIAKRERNLKRALSKGGIKYLANRLLSMREWTELLEDLVQQDAEPALRMFVKAQIQKRSNSL